MNKPSFFIAGNSKGGTTALYHFLRAHPGVFMCRPKEPNYFARDFCRDPAPDGAFHQRTEAEYLALFEEAQPDQRCGEASACYLYSQVAARALHDFDPDAKIIVMLREPVDFLYSYHLQLLKNPVTEGEREDDFARALALEPERRQGRQIPRGCLLPELLFYRERVRYAEQLRRFFDVFGREQVMVILHDDFKRDNAAVYREVLRFLDLDPSFVPTFEPHNKGVMLRSRRLRRMLRRVTFGEGRAAALKRLIKRVIPTGPRRALVAWIERRFVFKPKQRLDPAFARALKPQFYGEVAALGDLLGRDLLAAWGYDAVPHPEAPPALAHPLGP